MEWVEAVDSVDCNDATTKGDFFTMFNHVRNACCPHGNDGGVAGQPRGSTDLSAVQERPPCYALPEACSGDCALVFPEFYATCVHRFAPELVDEWHPLFTRCTTKAHMDPCTFEHCNGHGACAVNEEVATCTCDEGVDLICVALINATRRGTPAARQNCPTATCAVQEKLVVAAVPTRAIHSADTVSSPS